MIVTTKNMSNDLKERNDDNDVVVDDNDVGAKCKQSLVVPMSNSIV